MAPDALNSVKVFLISIGPRLPTTPELICVRERLSFCCTNLWKKDYSVFLISTRITEPRPVATFLMYYPIIFQLLEKS